MILCNLLNILREKETTITELSLKTGISRVSITALASNKSLGINYDTLNSICNVLHISPNEFFLYIDCDVTVLNCSYNNEILNITIDCQYSDESFNSYTLQFKYVGKDDDFFPTNNKDNRSFFRDISGNDTVIEFLEKQFISFVKSNIELNINKLNLHLIPILSLL